MRTNALLEPHLLTVPRTTVLMLDTTNIFSKLSFFKQPQTLIDHEYFSQSHNAVVPCCNEFIAQKFTQPLDKLLATGEELAQRCNVPRNVFHRVWRMRLWGFNIAGRVLNAVKLMP